MPPMSCPLSVTPAVRLAGQCLMISLVVALGACFESGPLELRLEPSATTNDANLADVAGSDSGLLETGGDGAGELSDTADSNEDAEAADGSDTLLPSADNDAVAVSDTPAVQETTGMADVTAGDGDGGGADANDSGLETDSGPVRACLVAGDCQGIASSDLCDGPLRCIDYGCRVDPSARVQCTGGGPCLDVRCNPLTGLCDSQDTCSCATPNALQCGIATSWSTNDVAAQPNVAAYGCGPARASESVRLFDLPLSGRVRVSASGDIAGLHVLAGEVCDGVTGCIAGGAGLLYFDAIAGQRYTLAVEADAPNQFVSVRADCDLTSETDCRDGLDDDGDGATDCEALECNGVAGCVRPPDTEVGLCQDLLDNDGDGAADCDDGDCGDDSGCLERCEILTGSVYCNYQQGLSNGSGKARSTHYACDPVPQTAKEMVFKIEAGYSGPLRIGFSGAAGLALHLLKETGRGCTPRDCVAMSTSDLFVDLVEGDIYYLAIDGPGAAVGEFSIEIDCLF